MKKISFSERYGMQQGVIARTKTMTRRENKKLNHPLVTCISEWGIDEQGKAYVTITYSTGLTEDVYPTYQVGEEVAVSQRYEEAIDPCDWVNKMLYEDEPGWKNKMFVRADLMPHRIRITNIRVERLQDITREDCMREGIYDDIEGGRTIGYPVGVPFYYTFVGALSNETKRQLYWTTAKEAFSVLIDAISGRGTWQRNPWVFVYEFELIK